MGYVPLNNYKYDSGYKRIQSGPDHEGYVVLYSGVQSTGPDEGIVVAEAPLSGTLALGAWDYDANWRYVPSTLPTQSGVLNPTPYNVSGALDTYDGARIYTRNIVAGAQIASAIGPQPGSTVNRPERYMYYGGAAPDNQNYSPYNTPDANSAAEGKTGGGVTHKTFESSLLTNVLGSQGTSDRSQWRYHQPVYCKTYTETKRSDVPGLMSTPLRAVYRGGSTSYNYNYGGELLASKGGFELLPSDYPPTSVTGSGFCPHPTLIRVSDSLSITPSCLGGLVSWYRVDSSTGNRLFLTEGSNTYTTVSGDIGYNIATDVACPDPYSSTGYGEPGSACFSSIVRPASVLGSGTITYPDPIFVTNTISGVASCVEGRISWYRVDTSTGSKSLITQYSSAYTTVSGDIGFAVAAEVECPDPYSPTGFGTPGSAGITSIVQPPFDPFAYEYVRPSVERWYGASNIYNPIPTDGPRTSYSRYRTSEIQGFRVFPRFSIFPFVYVDPDGPQALWAMTGNVTQVAGSTGQFNVLNIGVVFADGSGGEGNVPGFDWVVTNLQAPGIIIARIKTTFLFYDSPTGPVVATWAGYTFN